MVKKISLLEKAKKTVVMRQSTMNITDEDVELVLAWLKDEINAYQMWTAWGHKKYEAGKGGNYYRVSRIIKEALNRGLIKIK